MGTEQTSAEVPLWARGHLRGIGAAVLAGALSCAVGAASAAGAALAAPHVAREHAAPHRAVATPPIQVSRCHGPNAEAESVDAGADVYVVWIGCGGIGFARSTDAGRAFGPSLVLPGSLKSGCAVVCSHESWDPAIAISPTGVVYASFMYQDGARTAYPVVDASFNDGKSFAQSVALPVNPVPQNDAHANWGDRDFVAVDPHGAVYVTWDYGPSAAAVRFACSRIGSCSFVAGDLNAVVQRSTDGGRTWTALHPVSPGFPLGGADIAPIVVQPSGTLDVLYQGFPTNPSTLAFSPGSEYFTRSTDRGATWSKPVKIGAGAGTVSVTEWWIDGAISVDAAGDLYATWDTQSRTADIGWLSYSTNGGTTWSRPVVAAPSRGTAEQLVESVGAGPGIADIAWQTPTAKGYATFDRPFSVHSGWLAASPLRVSSAYGRPTVWPGDTFGMAALPTPASSARGKPVEIAWGSALGRSGMSEIYSSIATP